MTNSQEAAHESWLVRCSPCTPGFSCEQYASTPLILQESADHTCTQRRDPPPPSFLHANFVVIRENIFDTSRESNQGFHGGSSMSQPSCYILRLCHKFHRFFHATTTVQVLAMNNLHDIFRWLETEHWPEMG